MTAEHGMTPALEIDSLRFSYARRAAWSLEIPQFRLERGEAALLRGGSGKGKSTFLNVIAGLHDPERGRVTVDGVEMHSLSGAARDRFRGGAIGMIFQTFNLLHGFSAAENVMVALLFSPYPRSEYRSRALSLLEQLGIDDPWGDPSRMSVGQQQRVAVARAMACEPILVLADEPTASLDPENAERSMSLIQTICRERGAALLCASHDPAMQARFARIESMESLTSSRRDHPAHVADSQT